MLAVTILTSGCETYNNIQGYPAQRSDVGKQIKVLSGILNNTDLWRIDCEKDKVARNAYINNAMVLTDLEYNQMIRRLGGFKKGVDAAEEIAVGAMGAAGAIVGGGTSQILSAAVAATTAVAVSVDKTYFYNSTMPTMISAMNAQRKKVYADIAVGLNTPYSGYSVWTAYDALQSYYYAGSLDGAQSSINADSGKKLQTAVDNSNHAAAIATALETSERERTAAQKELLNQYNRR